MRPLYKFLLLVTILYNVDKLPAQTEKLPKDNYLIVLDIQQYYTHELLDSVAAENLIYSINSLLDEYEPQKVVYIRSMHKLLTLSFKGVKVDTADGMEFDHRLRVINTVDFVKSKPNAFSLEEFRSYLEENNAKNIVVVGLMAEYCVYQTLLGGKECGFEMFVVPDAIAAKSEKSKNKTLEKLKKKGVVVL